MAATINGAREWAEVEVGVSLFLALGGRFRRYTVSLRRFERGLSGEHKS
jgi:hypothetical protein